MGVIVALVDTSNGKIVPPGIGLAIGLTLDNGDASGSTGKADGLHITLVGHYNGKGVAITLSEE